MPRIVGQRVDVPHTGHSGQDGGGQHRAGRDMPAPVLSQTGPQFLLDSVARPFDHSLPAWMAMVRPTSRAGAGQDLVSTVLIPRAISDAQGWCRVMAYIQ